MALHNCKKDTYLQHESWNKKVEPYFAQPQLETCMSGDSNMVLFWACPWMTMEIIVYYVITELATE